LSELRFFGFNLAASSAAASPAFLSKARVCVVFEVA
jgi:hypothetical protein